MPGCRRTKYVPHIIKMLLLILMYSCIPFGSNGINPFKKMGRCYYKESSGIEIRYLGGYPYAKIIKKKLPDADPSSFELLRDSSSGGCGVGDLWGADSEHVFYRNYKIEGVHRSSFRLLEDGYARDDYRVYYRDRVVTGADPDTFKVTDKIDRVSHGRDSRWQYKRDRQIAPGKR